MAIIDIPCSDLYPDAPSVYAIAYGIRCMIESLSDLDVAQKEPFRTHFFTLKAICESIEHDCVYVNVVPF